MKFLIAGFGSIGRRHLRNLQALGENDILLYRTHHSTLSADEVSAIPIETDLEAALAHHPDALIVANPTALHLDVAIPAAKAGCSILMEKPISSSLEGVDDLQAALEKGGGRLVMGYQFRFHPGLQKVAALLAQGAVGRPLSVRAHWGEYLPAWHPWEDYRKSYSARGDLGGGVVLTLCHPLDYLRWQFGDVKLLSAFSGKFSDLEVEVEDLAEINLQFASGVVGSVHLDYCQRPPQHHLEIIGTQGTIRWDNSDGTVRLYQADRPEWQDFPLPQGFDRNDLFLDEMRHFVQVVRGAEKPACTLQDGIAVAQMISAVYDSSDQRRFIEL